MSTSPVPQDKQRRDRTGEVPDGSAELKRISDEAAAKVRALRDSGIKRREGMANKMDEKTRKLKELDELLKRPRKPTISETDDS